MEHRSLPVKNTTQQISEFVANFVFPAFRKLQTALQANGKYTTIVGNGLEISIQIDGNTKMEFVYSVKFHTRKNYVFAYPLSVREYDGTIYGNVGSFRMGFRDSLLTEVSQDNIWQHFAMVYNGL
jgi:hypothetical protein